MTLKTRLCFACAAGITVVSATAASADPGVPPTAPPAQPTDVPATPDPSAPIAPPPVTNPPPTNPTPAVPAPQPGVPVSAPPSPSPTTPPPLAPIDAANPPTTVGAPPVSEANTTVVATAPGPTRTVTIIEPDPYSYAWIEPRMQTRIGVGVQVGGGVTGFTDHTVRDTTNNVGGLWDVHLTLGTHVPIGLDVSYVGSAANLSTLAGTDNGQLIGTTVEGALRYNILPHMMVDPYVFAGVGWQRYDVQNVRFATSDTGLKTSDNFAEFPMGAGVAWRDLSGLTIDLRGTYRHAADSTLVLDPATGNYAAMSSWEASGGIGYEF